MKDQLTTAQEARHNRHHCGNFFSHPFHVSVESLPNLSFAEMAKMNPLPGTGTAIRSCWFDSHGPWFPCRQTRMSKTCDTEDGMRTGTW